MFVLLNFEWIIFFCLTPLFDHANARFHIEQGENYECFLKLEALACHDHHHQHHCGKRENKFKNEKGKNLTFNRFHEVQLSWTYHNTTKYWKIPFSTWEFPSSYDSIRLAWENAIFLLPSLVLLASCSLICKQSTVNTSSHHRNHHMINV